VDSSFTPGGGDPGPASIAERRASLETLGQVTQFAVAEESVDQGQKLHRIPLIPLPATPLIPLPPLVEKTGVCVCVADPRLITVMGYRCGSPASLWAHDSGVVCPAMPL